MRWITRFLLAMVALVAVPAQAAISFQLRTGNGTTNVQSMAIDSNKCATDGPRAAYVGGVITNTGPGTVTNVVATMGTLGNGFFLAGGQTATQAIGTLAAGESTGVYWFVGYGCADAVSATPTVTITSSTLPSTTALTLTAREAISANAGGRVTSSLLGPGAVVGQTIYFDATYEFGGTGAGDEYFLQPSGGQNFNAGCFRLVRSQIQSSTVTAIAAGTQSRQYFVASSAQPGSGYSVTVRYFFEYQCAGASTTARPYAVQTSGSSNIKYTGNFDGSGSISISFPGATNPFTIAKSANITTGYAGTATTIQYTVTVSNPSSNPSRISQFVDTLPAGASFVAIGGASGVTAANSSSVPSAGATGTIMFVGKQDQSYLIPAGGSVSLIYSVQMPTTAGTHVNSAYAAFGQATTATASASYLVYSVSPLTVVKASQAAADPVNGTTNPKLIPGATAAYTVTVTNPNVFALTADSVVVTDPTGLNLRFHALDGGGSGSGPVIFQDGAPASGLTYSFASLGSTTDDVDFSSDNGATWAYTPVPASDGSDSNVTRIRIRPRGAMAANSSFSLLFRYVVR